MLHERKLLHDLRNKHQLYYYQLWLWSVWRRVTNDYRTEFASCPLPLPPWVLTMVIVSTRPKVKVRPDQQAAITGVQAPQCHSAGVCKLGAACCRILYQPFTIKYFSSYSQVMKFSLCAFAVTVLTYRMHWDCDCKVGFRLLTHLARGGRALTVGQRYSSPLIKALNAPTCSSRAVQRPPVGKLF